MPATLPTYPWFLAVLREAIVALPLAVTVYMTIKQAGLWLWLAELQIHFFGAVFPSPTGFVCFLVALVGMGILHTLLSLYGWPARPMILRLLSHLIPVGARVFGNWQAEDLNYPGTMTERNGENLFIRYDKGGEEWTTMRMIRVAF